MDCTLVSVIIPTYGDGQYLGRAIKSVLNQTYKNIEIIVVDDNGIGTPNQLATQKVIDSFSGINNLFYVCHDVNKNGSVARNTGFRKSKGDYISLLDDDDEYEPSKIESLLNVLSQLPDDYAMAFGNAIGYDGKKIVYVNKARVTDTPLYDILLHRFSVGTSAFLIRRAAYQSVGGFDEEFLRHQDWEFFCKVIAKFKVKPVNVDASVRHLTRRNTPRSADEIIKYRRFYLQKMEPYILLLTPKEQKDVRIFNMLDVFMKYLSEGRYKEFVHNYYKLKPGYRGLKFLLSRCVVILKRGSLKGKE